jgi:hypothetical protein
MREYVVPFSTKGEDRLFFNLTARQCLWLAGGLMLGLAAVFIPAAAFRVSFPAALAFVPLGLPFLGAGAYLALKKVRDYDHDVGADVYLFRKLHYRFRSHDYILH